MPKRNCLCLLFLIAALASSPVTAEEMEPLPLPLVKKPIDHIIAIVNEDVITRQELDDAIKIATERLQLQGIQIPDHSTLQNQVLESIITKRIQLQHAKDVGLAVSESEIDETIRRIADDNKLSLPEFYAAVDKDGINHKKFRSEINEEMIMARLKEREVKHQVNVTEGEVDNFLRTQETSAVGNDE